MASLDSPLAKFNRASEQHETLIRDLSALSNLQSYTFTKNIDNATGYQIHSFANVPPIPDDLGLRIGEMLYNFRCSLDHLIWKLVLSNGNDPTVRNEFPIFNDTAKYNSEKGSKLKGVSNTVIPIIDALQPCNSTPPDDYWWYLWYLHELSNADKHRYLLLTRRALARKMHLIWTSPQKSIRGNYFSVPVEKGAVFFRVESNVNVKINPTIQILFSNAPSSIRADLPVRNIIDFIKGSVCEVFDRLGSHIK